ncbi:MAG: hypothetical protein ACR2M0_12925 [Chloroflexia bacterium]
MDRATHNRNRLPSITAVLIAAGVAYGALYLADSLDSRLEAVGFRVLLDGGIDAVVFLAAYGTLKALRISVDWAAWVIAMLLAGLSLLTSVLTLAPGGYRYQHDILLGLFSVLVGGYAVGLWAARRLYLLVRPWALPLLVPTARSTMRFLRKQHQLLGWLVLITATGHATSYLPILDRISSKELVSGLLAWIVLVFLSVLGLWVEYVVGHRRILGKWSVPGGRWSKSKSIARSTRFVHTLTAIVFFVILLAHV